MHRSATLDTLFHIPGARDRSDGSGGASYIVLVVAALLQGNRASAMPLQEIFVELNPPGPHFASLLSLFPLLWSGPGRLGVKTPSVTQEKH